MNHCGVSIYQRGLSYFLAAYLALLAAWCLAHSQAGRGAPPLLVIGSPTDLDLLPPLPARELPTPADPPLEFYASVASIRTAAQENTADVVIIFTHPLNYQIEPLAGGGAAVLLYPLDRASLNAALGSLEGSGFSASVETVSRFGCRLLLRHSGDLVPRLEAAMDGKGTSVTIHFEAQEGADEAAGPGGRVRERGHRTLTPGLELKRMDWFAANGAHADLHVIEVDLTHGGIHLALALGKPVLHKRTLLTTMARDAGALAGINASFFGLQNGDPLGLLIDRGKVIAAPVFSRTSFGVYQHQKVLFGNPDFSGRFNTPGGSLPVKGLNENRSDGALSVYTPEFGHNTRTRIPGVEVAVSGGRVVGVGSQDLVIPEGGIVVALHGARCRALEELTIGDAVTFEYGVTPPWSLCDLALGGGPRLLKDGKPLINSAEERFDARFARERAPRSAVGVTADGKLILAAVDGRHPPRNCGATLAELAKIMLELHCVHAMNLDGGGSTTMVVGDEIVNTPSDGREREVSTGILVLPGDAPQTQAGVESASN